MKSVSVLIPIAFLICGCTSPSGSLYVQRHPELTAEQKKIFTEKKITSGTEVAGLTKDQIRLIMGKEPAHYENMAGGENAWIYEKEIHHYGDLAPQLGNGPAAQMGILIAPTDADQVFPFEVTTIYFKGDVATHAQVTRDQHPR